MEPQNTPHGKVAFEFASALVAGNFDSAYQMLSATAKSEWPRPSLESEYREMVDYFDVPPNFVQVMNTMDEWPGRRSGDLGWAYAAIAGEGQSEAVTVVACEEGGNHLVRSIEWGRP